MIRTLALALIAAFTLLALQDLCHAQDAGADMATMSADAGTAGATATPDPGVDPTAYAKDALDAMRTKNWRMLAALALIGLTWAGRKFAIKLPGKAGAFFATDRGGAVLALLMGIFGGMGTALFAAKAFGWHLLTDGIVMGFTAAGGYAVLRKIAFGTAENSIPSKAPAPAAAK